MRVLLTGGAGQLGIELKRQAAACGLVLVAPERSALDVTHPAEIERAVSAERPAALVNAAAYTQVDRAEAESESAFAVNAAAPAAMAEICRRLQVPLLHVSTDYVFDGEKGDPYREDDPIAPISTYGRSKAEGEAAVRSRLDAHIIIRTSWLYSAHRSNFLKTILRLASEREELRVVDDQLGSPTCAADLAAAILSILKRLSRDPRLPWGTYHYCGAGVTTWHGFAAAIADALAAFSRVAPARIVPIPTRDYPTPARRPRYSVLDCTRIGEAFGILPRAWRLSTEDTVLQLLTAGVH